MANLGQQWSFFTVAEMTPVSFNSAVVLRRLTRHKQATKFTVE